MTTVKEQLTKIIFEEITVLNGDNTEEDLNMSISNIIAEERLKEAENKNVTIIADGVLVAKKYDVEDDVENVEPLGAWVYCNNSLDNLIFDRYLTVADAIRAAVKIINATIICNGDIVNWDAFNDEEAYYIDNESDKVKLVKLNS